MDFKLELENFKNHLDQSVLDMMDENDKSGNIDPKYNVTISVNGKSIVIPCNADAYANIERLIYDELDDYREV